jgi:hypothetical protein
MLETLGLILALLKNKNAVSFEEKEKSSVSVYRVLGL